MKTRNIRSLFPLKDKSNYKSCVIYKEHCSCGSCYIGEAERNAEVRWDEHYSPTKSLEPLKHLRSNMNHSFRLAVISNAPKNAKTTKNLEHHMLLSENEEKILTRESTSEYWQ